MSEELKNQQELNQELRETIGLTDELSEAQNNVSNDILDSVKKVQGFKTEVAEIRNVTRDINRITSRTLSLNTSELGTRRNLAKLLNDEKKTQSNIEILERQREFFANKRGKAAERLVGSLDDQIDRAKKFKGSLQGAIQASENLRNNFGVGSFEGVASFLKEIPILSTLAGPFEDAAEKAREIAVSSENLGAKGFFGKLDVGIKSFMGSMSTLVGSLAKLASAAVLGLIVSAFTLLDKSSGAIAKQLGISSQEALKISKSFNEAALASDNVFINTENLTEAQVTLSKALGTNNIFNKDLLVTQTELTKQAGITVETATQLSKLQLVTGKGAKNITSEFLGQAKALNLQNDLSITEKDLLEDINKISKGTLLVFASQPKELAKAVFQAKALGLSIDQLEKSANSLLDIESSLTAEFEAEVLMGRQLNLEKARLAALNNDLSTVGKELENQGFNIKEFTEGSVLEQQAMAEAVGLTRDELAGSLMEQQAIKNVGAANAEELKEQFLAVKGTAKEQEFLNSLGNEQYAAQLASTTQTEQFLAVVNKLKEGFVSIAEPLMNIVEPIVNILAPALQGLVTLIDYIKVGFEAIQPAIKPIAVLLGVLYAKSIGLAIVNIFGSIFRALGGLPIVGPALALAAIGAAVTKLKSDSKATQTGDLAIDPGGGPVVYSPQVGGLFQGNKRDGVRLGTPSDLDGRNGSSTVVLSDAQIQKIANAVREGASKATINLDGNRVSSNLQTPMVLNTLPGV